MTSFPHDSSSAADSSTPGRILGIDYGQRWIGLAVSDALGLTAHPLATLERTNRRNDLRRLGEIVRAQQVRRVVVGHPLRLDGSSGDRAAEVQRFAARLAKHLRLPVEMVDERLSSWEAEHVMAATQASATKRAGKTASRREGSKGIDAVAAAVILRDYLERGRARLEPATDAARASAPAAAAAPSHARRKRKQARN